LFVLRDKEMLSGTEKFIGTATEFEATPADAIPGPNSKSKATKIDASFFTDFPFD